MLFGTDGIRGHAGVSPLTLSEARMLGWAAGSVLKKHFQGIPHRVVIVRDTRASGVNLVKELSRGFMSQGIQVYDAGILCTPSVAYLVQSHRFQAGVVVSASHNPPEFNGIKFFTPHGRKWPDTWERMVEKIFNSARLRRGLPAKRGPTRDITPGITLSAERLASDYESFVKSTLPQNISFSSLKVAVDASNGANFSLAPKILKDLGAQVFVTGHKPNGRNINMGCGSQHTGPLTRLVKKHKCHIGMAFDGDGDRIIFVDERGTVIDGDFIMGLLAKHFKARGQLKNNCVVITVMANMGLRRALHQLGVKAIETAVGDRYVSDGMQKEGATLGGEQSGHIILGQYLPTGDGLLTGLQVLAILQQSKKPFSELVGWIKKCPQVLVNVHMKEKKPIEELNGFFARMKQIERSLGESGRILVRYSGTEPLLRIMLEGPSKEKLDQYASQLVEHLHSTSAS